MKFEPNVLIDPDNTSTEIGDAPYTIVPSVEKSISFTSGTISMNCSTAGTANMFVIRFSGMICSIAIGSTSRSRIV